MKLVATTYRSRWKMSNVQTSNITIAFTQSRASSTVYNLKIYLNLPVQTSKSIYLICPDENQLAKSHMHHNLF